MRSCGLIVAGGILMACGGPGPGAAPREAGTWDAGSPAPPEAGAVDAAADTRTGAPDARTDAPPDAAPDAPAGTASDAAKDVADAGPAADPPGVFVAVGYGGRRMRSVDDGRTWLDDQSLEANGGDDQDLLRTVAFGDGRFLAAGWQTLSSPDGKTWTASPPTKQNWFGALAHAGAAWVGVGGYGMRVSSPDGTAWTDHAIDTTAAHPHGCLAVVPGPAPAFVACNDDGARSWSADGATWSYATGATGVASSQVVAGAGVVVGVDGANVVVSHDAGHTWAGAATLDTAGGGLVFAQGRFTLLATGAVFTSADGTSWQKHAAPGVEPAALAFGHGAYVAVRAHAWQRSDDGLTWEAAVADAAKDNALEWVTFGAVGGP